MKKKIPEKYFSASYFIIFVYKQILQKSNGKTRF